MDCFKLEINWKNDNDVTICQHDVIVKFFDVILFLLSSLNHVNIITGSEVMTIYFHKGLTRNLEIPLSEFCQISRD